MTSIRKATVDLLERLRPGDLPAETDARFFVAPGSISEAAEVISGLQGAGLSLGFLGAGTHQGIGGRQRTDVVMQTSGLDRVIDFEPDDLTVVVEAGVRVADLEDMLARHGLTAVLPEQPGGATVGGVIAAGLSGYRRLRYGPTRDRVLEVTMATGYGKVIRAGGRVVKNVTGYDLPRLAVGSLGALGMIGSVALKLWPVPPASASIEVEDPAAALHIAYRPLAVLEVDGTGIVSIGGTPEEIAAEADLLGGDLREGLFWPEPTGRPVRFTVAVPPRHIVEAIAAVRELEPAVTYRAQHGVGLIEVGTGEASTDAVGGLRAFVEELGGTLVLVDAPDQVYRDIGAWGSPPPSLALQRRVKAAFDPDGMCNPGRFPGGL